MFQVPNKDIVFDGGVVDIANREIRHEEGTKSRLTWFEFVVLTYLANHAGRPVSREEFLEQVWRINPNGTTTRTVDMHIAKLRHKLRDDPTHPKLLITIRGMGYMMLMRNN